MQKILLGLVTLILLSSCGAATTDTTNSESKIPYNIDVVTRGALSEGIEKEKAITITASSNLTLTAQSAGEVSSILYQEGKHVALGQPIIMLKDTVSNVDLGVAQARNNILLQDANTATTKINLDQAINAAETAYDQAQLNYNNLMNQTSLQYANTLKTNDQTLKTYNENYQSSLSSVEALMTQLLYEGDKILGMTTQFENSNNGYESYLGAASGNSYADAKDAWNIVYDMRAEIRAKLEHPDLNIENSEADIALIAQAYAVTRDYADKMIFMLQNNVFGAQLSMDMSNAWVATWNGFRSSVGASEQAYTSWRAQTKTFFDTYSENAEAIRLATTTAPLSATELRDLQTNSALKLTYDNTKFTLSTNIEQAKLALKQTEENLNNAKKLRDATLNQLSASKSSAEIALSQAERAASKLRITAPVNGIVTKILVEKGQTVNVGTPVVQFSGNDPQAVVEVDPRIALLLPVESKVQARLADGTLIDGVITASSAVASNNMLSTIRVAFPGAAEYIGRGATLILTLNDTSQEIASVMLPINAVDIIEEGVGRIHLYRNGQIVDQDVRLGALYGKNIEVFTDIPGDAEIILNDVKNYDSDKYSLVPSKS